MVEKLKVYLRFEELVARILEKNGFTITDHDILHPDKGYDFIATRDQNVPIVVEAKYYRTASPQVALLEAAASRLYKKIPSLPNARAGMLVVSCDINPKLRKALEKKHGLVFIDRATLQNLANIEPDLADQLNSILEISETEQRETAVRDFRDFTEVVQPPIAPPDVETPGTDLCNELKALQPGKEDWPTYEDLCERILGFLFPNDLHIGHKQMRTDDDLNRFDYICRLKPTTDFWKFLIDHLNSRYVVFEFKNYGNPIKQGQILTTEKYLLEKALRRVAIMFTRRGPDENAVKMTQGAMREHGKLILVLDDEKVCEMLTKKEKGDDPTDLLFDIADEFLLTLPR